jgi:dihydroorotate dehydrogenase
MYQYVRPLLFRLEPERAHSLTVSLLRAAAALPPVAALLRAQFRPAQPASSVRAFGLTFSNPLGLAAGYDKDGLAWRGLAALGFGHIEVGTVTVRPQGGNDGPRVFRIPESEAVINRMGFPNRGAEVVARRLQGPRPAGLVLGVNIGKNKDTPLEEAAQDYTSLIRTFAPLADYLAVNISSPNTPGLRALQSGPALEALLADLRVARLQAARQLGRNVPILLKLAPDLSQEQLVEAVGAIRQSGMDGIILSNTTLRREGLTSPLASESGGMSGKPLRAHATALLREVVDLTRGRYPIIAAGGVMSPEDALEKLDAGATLVQVYTGLIYRGPALVKAILEHPAFRTATVPQPVGGLQGFPREVQS